MTAAKLPVLEHQHRAHDVAAKELDTIQRDGASDLATAFAREPALVGEAANGRTANAVRAMQLEAEVRINPELRADRFVQQWQGLRAQRDKLGGWQNEDARKKVEISMTKLAGSIEKDPQMGRALATRGNQLIGRQWSLEWSVGSRDGGIGRELTDRALAKGIGQELGHSLGRGRGLGIGM